ncbi:MAG: Hsp20/alpha crystallin family protein [Solirubrobacteraceae bacterium]
MTLIRWEPVRVQSDLNRLLNSFFDTPTIGGPVARRHWTPAMDLVQTDGEYVLRADLPGLGEDDVKIELDENVLTISGERHSEHEQREAGWHRVERSSGSFRRSLRLPEGVDADAIRATFDKGVLEVTVPKPEQRQPRRVQITVGSGAAKAEESEAIESTETAAA